MDCRKVNENGRKIVQNGTKIVQKMPQKEVVKQHQNNIKMPQK